MLALLVTAALAAPVQGNVRIVTSAGLLLSEETRPRLAVSVEWYPFDLDDWGGLGEVGGQLVVLSDVAAVGNAAIAIGTGYGRPRPGLWGRFEFLGALTGGWGGRVRNGFELAFTPAASLRAGYGSWGLGLFGFISSARRIFHRGDYYSLTVEYAW